MRSVASMEVDTETPDRVFGRPGTGGEAKCMTGSVSPGAEIIGVSLSPVEEESEASAESSDRSDTAPLEANV